jgi:hypothetical protein
MSILKNWAVSIVIRCVVIWLHLHQMGLCEDSFADLVIENLKQFQRNRWPALP